MAADKKASNSMHWTKAHDTLLCREVLALEPYKHKKGSNEAGKIWTDVAQSLKNCQQLKFKQNLSQRAVRERFALLQAKYKEKESEEIHASGISPEQDELDVLLEEITEREKAAEENKEDVNRKKQNDKATAEEMRKQAMERMGQTKKRKKQEDNEDDMKERRKRRSGSDAVEFLKEKCEREMTLREEEIEMKKKEQQDKASQFEVMFNQKLITGDKLLVSNTSAGNATATSTTAAAEPESASDHGPTKPSNNVFARKSYVKAVKYWPTNKLQNLLVAN